jgi:Glycosyl hydrolase 36 superfamily, catalytic domain
VHQPKIGRRQFTKSLGGVAAGGWAFCGYDAIAINRGSSTRGSTGRATSKAYGSGHFGEWIEDQFGLPAYRYTCDQSTDPKAVTAANPQLRSPTDHTHQIGNDRLVAAASNYGYVQVRQDEGSPKFLNDYSPERGQYGGGIGFLADGKEVLSTFYPGNAKSFDRVFGMGYLRKKVTGSHSAVDHVIFAPFGDDPLLISQVTIMNRSQAPADLRWVEYWGCQPYQFSFRSTLQAIVKGAEADWTKMAQAADLRRRFGDRFAHHFRLLADQAGLLETKQFMGRSAEDEHAWQEVLSALANQWNAWFIEPAENTPPKVSMEDLAPPPTFLVALDAPADGFATNGKAFFGAGGVIHPVGLADGLDGDLASSGPESALLLERRFRLGPGESRTLYFAYGYLSEGLKLDSFLDRYRKNLSTLWQDSSRHWKADGLRLRVDSEPWVERELAWHHYYLRSNLTYDSYFQEHIESQGGEYQYIQGFQGPAEDSLQHTLPFVYSHPWIVKQALRHTLKELQPNGRVPYAIAGQGALLPIRILSSSCELWVLWLASEYVLGTRDSAFLDEEIQSYPLYGPTGGKDTVRNLLARCYRHLVKSTGTGEHGLIHMLNGDWDDGLLIGSAHELLPKHPPGEILAGAESVANSAMATYVFDHYARLLRFIGDAELGADAERRAQAHRLAVRAQWTGRWFRRAWLTSEGGWLGEKELWLVPQPWAIIGGASTEEQTRELIEAMDALLRQPSPIGAMRIDKAAPGVGSDGGVWFSLNALLIWALARADGKMAWDEWQKNSLARHAEIYPQLWYGIWSGPDSFSSVLSKDPGRTGPDFPVMNMHAHSEPLFSAAKLLGVEFTEGGLVLAPNLPLGTYSFDSPLVGVRKSRGQYEGWYAPVAAGTWTITLRLPADEVARIEVAQVNGREQALRHVADGAVEFKGENAPGKPLRWALRNHFLS